MSDDLASHRKRAQALMHYIIFESELTDYRGPNAIRFPISTAVRRICDEKSVKRFSIADSNAISLFTDEQCEILEEACRQTYGHLWIDFNEKSAAA